MERIIKLIQGRIAVPSLASCLHTYFNNGTCDQIINEYIESCHVST